MRLSNVLASIRLSVGPISSSLDPLFGMFHRFHDMVIDFPSNRNFARDPHETLSFRNLHLLQGGATTTPGWETHSRLVVTEVQGRISKTFQRGSGGRSLPPG
jgi:hypothetical protein